MIAIHSIRLSMFVRASLVRSWFAAPSLVRESTEAVKRLSSSRVRAGGKAPKRRFEPLKENPDFVVPLDQYDLRRNDRDQTPPATPVADTESEDDSDFETSLFEEDDRKEDRLLAYRRSQRRHQLSKEPEQQRKRLTLKDIPPVPK